MRDGSTVTRNPNFIFRHRSTVTRNPNFVFRHRSTVTRNPNFVFRHRSTVTKNDFEVSIGGLTVTDDATLIRTGVQPSRSGARLHEDQRRQFFFATGSASNRPQGVFVGFQEAARAQAPTIVIDVKGDPPNLLLAFPGSGCRTPRALDRVGREGLGPDEIAARAAELAQKRAGELAQWQIGEPEANAVMRETQSR
jgi:hypothetical protein